MVLAAVSRGIMNLMQTGLRIGAILPKSAFHTVSKEYTLEGEFPGFDRRIE
jgi:hypothetical protein